MSEPKTKKIKMLYCKNSECKKFLCRTDGEVLFVENLEIAPVVAEQHLYRKNIIKKLICGNCRQATRVGLKSSPGVSAKPASKGKFSIFRKRF